MSLNHLFENSIKDYLNPGVNQLRTNRLISGVIHPSSATYNPLDVTDVNTIIVDNKLVTLQSLSNGIDGQVINLIVKTSVGGSPVCTVSNLSGSGQQIQNGTNANVLLPLSTSLTGNAQLVYSATAGVWYCYNS